MEWRKVEEDEGGKMWKKEPEDMAVGVVGSSWSQKVEHATSFAQSSRGNKVKAHG